MGQLNALVRLVNLHQFLDNRVYQIPQLRNVGNTVPAAVLSDEIRHDLLHVA